MPLLVRRFVRPVLAAALSVAVSAPAVAQPARSNGGADAPGAPPVPPGALRIVSFTWHAGRAAICAEEPGPAVEQGERSMPRTRVWVRDGTATRQVATGPGTCDPVWSPQGDLLAVAAPDGLWVLSADLRRTTHLVDTRQAREPANGFERRTVHGPQWAPDASALAFVVSDGTTSWVEVIDARTGAERYASDEGTADFAWEPDSRSLRFGSYVIRIP